MVCVAISGVSKLQAGWNIVTFLKSGGNYLGASSRLRSVRFDWSGRTG